MDGEIRQQTQMNNSKKQKGKGLRRILVALLFMTIVCAVGLFVYTRIFRVQPVFSSAVYELGDRVSRSLEDYLQGAEWAVAQGELDLSQVDEGRAGTYHAFVSRGRTEYQYEIIIEDTIPPEIISGDGTVYLAAGREYGADDLVSGVTDEDPRVEVYIQEDSELRRSVSFDAVGSHTCIVIAEDSSGNRNGVSVSVVVDTAPEISGVRDIYLVQGNQVDYLEQVTALDETDGNLTGRITVDDSQVQLDRQGSYRLTYRVEDSYGLDAVSYANVTVTSARELQEMIGSRQIDRHSDKIIGAMNLYDSGASENDNIVEALDYVRPALVQLYHGDRSGYSAGSGYVMEITEDTIYICSNRHVVEVSDRWDVYFFDGTRVTGKTLGYSDSYDVGVATVAVRDVPQKLMERLMTVHVDREYWNGLNDHRIDVGLERVDQEGGLVHTSVGSLLKVKQYFAWYDNKDHTEITATLEHGDSGSAVVDGHGNLIGMAFAYSVLPRRYWCIPLDEILNCYEEITGRRVATY